MWARTFRAFLTCSQTRFHDLLNQVPTSSSQLVLQVFDELMSHLARAAGGGLCPLGPHAHMQTPNQGPSGNDMEMNRVMANEVRDCVKYDKVLADDGGDGVNIDEVLPDDAVDGLVLFL